MLSNLPSPVNEHMASVLTVMEERQDEINSYVEFISILNKAIRDGLPSISNNENTYYKFNTDIIHICYANTYMLYYNYIESIMTLLFDALGKTISNENKLIHEFSEKIKKIWVKHSLNLKNDKESININTIIDKTVICLNSAIKAINDINFSKGNGGNFNDEVINKSLKNIDIKLNLPKHLMRNLRILQNKTYSDNDTCLKEVCKMRNTLAHGGITFSGCGKDIDIDTLKEIKDVVFAYIDQVYIAFNNYIIDKSFLQSAECLTQ